jgi:hypothetical protein
MDDNILGALTIALAITFTVAWMVGFWAITGSIKDARQAGYRYPLINPLAVLAGFRTKKYLVFLVSWLIGAAAIGAIFLLLHLSGKL